MAYGARAVCLALIVITVGADRAAANDSAAELAAGGLVLVKSDAITMQREDLTLSPSEVRQVFSKVGWLHGKTSINLSFGYADNWLTGNGLQDSRFLPLNYSSVYSIPDVTWNRSPSLNLSLRHNLTNNLTLSGNAYFRYIRADTTNGDINEESFDESIYNLSGAVAM